MDYHGTHLNLLAGYDEAKTVFYRMAYDDKYQFRVIAESYENIINSYSQSVDKPYYSIRPLPNRYDLQDEKIRDDLKSFLDPAYLYEKNTNLGLHMSVPLDTIHNIHNNYP